MKWLIAILATLSIVSVGRAQSSDAFGNRVKVDSVNRITNATPAATVTNVHPDAVYHTYQLTGTNAFSYCIHRSVDQTNWFIGATNAVAANVVAEATLTGKYPYTRVLIQGTNVGLKIGYFGGQ